MDTKDAFEKLKNISPRREYAEYSRRLIVSYPQNSNSPFAYARRIFIDTFRMGTSIAMAAALLLVIVNATFLWKILPSPQVAVLDPVGLRAEAQAIDIQIHLAQLNFGELSVRSSTAAGATTTVSKAINGPSASAAPETAAPSQSSTQQVGTATPDNATSSPPIGIDDALQILGE